MLEDHPNEVGGRDCIQCSSPDATMLKRSYSMIPNPTHDARDRPPRQLAREAIAICGISLRLPGGIHKTSDFWNLLINGKDARGPMTPGRLASPGVHNHKCPPVGYYLDENLCDFDPSTFKLSRSELQQADPQQRKLLQITRECLDNAGEAIFRGKNVGCYVGTFGDDWMQMLSRDDQFVGGIDFRGTIDAMLANRLSYEFDFKGPSMVIKTGCSSSLVCLHEATRALQFGDCDAAIVAGSNILIGTTLTDSLTQHGVLSPDTSSKTFDVAANGYARAEAVNCIYIKRLSDALRDGNPIRAVLRGTGTNSDGHSQGITMPDPAAHVSLMQRTYLDSGLDPARTAYVECHGTGTAVGDRMETSAVAKVFGKDGISIGSVKPNVGHSEGASGLTSLIKAILILENGFIPPQIKLRSPNPDIEFSDTGLRVALKATALPLDRARRISVNSFGIGGSNAHAIVESWTEGSRIIPDQTAAGSRVLLFSGGTEKAVHDSIQAHAEYLEEHPQQIDKLAYSLACRREKHQYRAYATSSPQSTTFATSSVLEAPTQTPRVIMAFSGQGAQWVGMMKDLANTDIDILGDLRTMDAVLDGLPHAPPWHIQDVLQNNSESSILDRADFAQPLCTAIQIALVNAYRRIGITPDAVIGHSSGEIAAAYACGGISMSEAIIAAYYRGVAATSCAAHGAMAAVGLSANAVSRILDSSRVTIACENGPSSITLSGDAEELDRTLEIIRAHDAQIPIRRLTVGVAYHSHHMNTVVKEYQKLMYMTMPERRINIDLEIPMFSTALDIRLDNSAALTSTYWCTNLCAPVRFYSATKQALQSFPDALFLEIGPHSTLAGPLQQIFAKVGTSNKYVPTLLRSQSAQTTFLSAIGRLYQYNVPIDFTRIVPQATMLQDLPSYPWDNTSLHVKSRLLEDRSSAYYERHTLLGQRIVESSALEPSWRAIVSMETESWIQEHVFGGDVVFPFTGYIALATEACRQMTEGDHIGVLLRHVVAHTAMVIREPTIEIVTSLKQVRLSDKNVSDWWEFNISSYSGTAWIQHCHGQVKNATEVVSTTIDPSPLEQLLPSETWYSHMKKVGIEWGPDFQRLSEISYSRFRNEVQATMKTKGVAPVRAGVDPCVLDQALQLVVLARNRGLTRPQRLCIPTVIEGMYLATSTGDLSATAWTSDNNVCNTVECYQGEQLAIRLSNIQLTDVHNTALDDTGDKHAAASLHWAPDVELAHNDALFSATVFRRDNDALIEELVVLCMIDSARVLDGVSPGVEHRETYRYWLQTRISSFSNESYSSFCQLDTEQLHAGITSRFEELVQIPDKAAIAMGIKRTQENAERLMKGEIDMLEVLTEDGVLTEFYAAISYDCGQYIAALSHKEPLLRILEVGAGTGGTTALILDELFASSPKGSHPYASYTFTDVSAGFFPQAKDRFMNRPGMCYKILDISQEPLSQGFELGSFDVIIAANVIHATPSLNKTLTHLHSLLRDGGRLVFSELETASRVPGYVFGWFAGWWLGANDNRKDEPFVSIDRWRAELTDTGFDIERSVTDRERPHQFTTLVVARKETKSIPSAELPGGSVTVLCNNPHGESTDSILRYLVSKGLEVSVARLGEALGAARHVISTIDMDFPLFGQLTRSNLEMFQKTLRSLQSASVLWVMAPAQHKCRNPDVAASLGVLRTARLELGLAITTLEIEITEPSLAERVYSVWEQTLSIYGIRQEVPDYEYIVDQGTIKIGRHRAFNLVDERKEKRGMESPRSNVITLQIEQPGLLSTVGWIEKPACRNPLADDEVEIETRAIGVNFHDLAMAMGIISHEAADIHFGLEFSGIVADTGSLVHNLQPGDRVFGVSSGGMFASRFRIASTLVAPIPNDLSFEDAATMGNYTTIILAILEIGRMQAGQSILIHSACGGVGQAALQMCQSIGILPETIFATVGSAEKVEYLKEKFGIPHDHIFDSHDAKFKNQLMRTTEGKGVDLVLNSLAGELLHASWECVAPFGTMVELSRRDLADFGKLSLRPFLENKSFSCIDMHHAIENSPNRVAILLAKTMELYRNGQVGPIRPIKVYDAADAQYALRRLQHADHMGKVVVSMPRDLQSITRTLSAPLLHFKHDGAYLLVGGLGGLGRAIARWMVERGAQHLVLFGRHAGDDQRHNQAIAGLTEFGCNVTVVKGSVEDPADVVKAINAAPVPLKGVVHLAMVLRDTPLVDMTFDDWDQAQGPKVRGAWNLHNAFGKSIDLDFFVLASSLITVDPMPGQSNYCAANTWIEAFCHYRRERGLPASVLSIGAVEGAGFVSEHAHAEKNMRARGTLFLPPEKLMDYLELAVLSSKPGTSIDVARPWEHTGHLIMGMKPDPARQKQDRRWAYYADSGEQISFEEGYSEDRLKVLVQAARRNPDLLDDGRNVQILAEEIGKRIFTFLLKPASNVHYTLAIADLGLDSLLSIELRRWWKQVFGQDVSSVEIMSSGTLLGLANIATDGLRGNKR